MQVSARVGDAIVDGQRRRDATHGDFVCPMVSGKRKEPGDRSVHRKTKRYT